MDLPVLRSLLHTVNGNKYIGNTNALMRQGRGKLITKAGNDDHHHIYKGFWDRDLIYHGCHLDTCTGNLNEGRFKVKNGQYLYHGDGILYYKNGIKCNIINLNDMIMIMIRF